MNPAAPIAHNRYRPVVLLILDGWGYREETADNAIALAQPPNWQRLWRERPHTLVHTSGLRVGLPEGQMGNSEVGHMNLGAGRVVYQELTRIDRAITEGTFQSNAALLAACDAAITGGGTLHLLGLLSPGGVHSHEEHLYAMLRMASARGVPRTAIHVFLDGRDTPPRSAMLSLLRLQAVCEEVSTGLRYSTVDSAGAAVLRRPDLVGPVAGVASVSGRYYGMDRDSRWERLAAAWQAIVAGQSEFEYANPIAALEAAYARGENDEFVKPSVIGGGAPISDGDAVVFMNFRADRARQLTQALVLDSFSGFDRGRRPRLSTMATLTEYAEGLPVQVAYPPADLHDTLPQLVAQAGMRQLRIAETEKYAHVTFFFSGGVEQPYPGEERVLVPSPKVATYDLQPEMSCPEVTERLCAAIRHGGFDLIVCNIANPDMVGHTGMLDAAILAVRAVDQALGSICAAVEETGGAMLITADHGNLEMMRDAETGQPHTQHTTGPVPLVLVGAEGQLRADGALCDIAPTLLQLLGMPVPAAMTGHSLLQAG